MKRIVTTLAFLSFLLSTVSARAVTAENKEVRIGYQAASTIILLGKAKKFYDEEFAKAGYKVNYGLFLSGPPMIEAFAGDRLDFIHTGDMPPVNGRSGGIDLKVIANAGLDPSHNAVLVAPDSPIKSPVDLKGKKVALPVGSSAHHFLYLLLAKNGLKVTDVSLVNLPAPDLGNALGNHDVDAIAVWEPFTAKLELDNKAKVLADSKGIKRAVNVYLTRNAFGKANPKLVQIFLKATKRSIDFYKSNPKEAIAAISQESKFPEAVVSKIIQRYNFSLAISKEDINALGQVKDFLQETKTLRKDFPINDLFDLSYLKKSGH